MNAALNNPFFTPNHAFETFSWDHFHGLIYILIIGFLSIMIARKYLDFRQQVILGVLLSIFPLVAVLARMYYTYRLGTFTIQDELPLHLCRTLALIMPFALAYKNDTWLGIGYFCILGGTLQALITPDLYHTLPHFSYYVYFIVHTGLFILPFYYMFVFGFRPTKRDLWNTMIFLNAYMIVTFIVNYAIDANYFYTLRKPISATPLDYFGPWPIYLIVVEILALLVFFILYLPFRKYESKKV